jgi:hypothetical protein
MISVWSHNKAIGGYFELELPRSALPEKYPAAIKYQSARAAFLALLRHLPNCKRVWVPYYICDSMLAPALAAGKELNFYHINQALYLSQNIDLKPNDVLLYVNYFGVCDANVARLLDTYDSRQVIVDCSQAFYSGPFDCLATIYSPRKFFGIPDGGLLQTAIPIPEPVDQDKDSIHRMDHLLKRLAFGPEVGYENYLKSEASLNDFEPKRMSILSRRLFLAANYEEAKNQRIDNFSYIHKTLGSDNGLRIHENACASMSYPYFPSFFVDKSFFRKNRIFIPTYWKEVYERVTENSFEHEIVGRLLPIPCDQRYGIEDFDILFEMIEEMRL